MSFLQSYPFYLSTLSPVHIGSGDDYEPGNYLIDKGWLYYFDPAQLADALNERQRQALLSIVDQMNLNESSLIALQNYFKNLKHLIKPLCQYQIPVSDGVEQFYYQKLGRVSQQEGRGRDGRSRKVANKLEIERSVQNYTNGNYYIPGSSLKGGVRTAIINALKSGKSLTRDEQRNIKNSSKARRISQRLQQQALQYEKVTDDPLKWLKISDVNFTANDFPQSTIQFCINRKRTPARTKSRAEQKSLVQILECIAADHYRSMSGEIRLQTDQHQLLKKLGIHSVQQLAIFCNEFYLPQLQQELEELKASNLLPQHWQAFITTLFTEKLGDSLKSGAIMLLRLGKHGGAVSKTLDGIRAINIPQQKRITDKPSTIWLAANTQKQSHDLLPFGWVLLEWQDNPEIDILKQYMSDNTQNLRELYTRFLKQRQQEFAEQEALQKKEQEIKRQALQAEQEKQQALKRATVGLSELAAELATRRINEQWDNNKDYFLSPGLIEGILEQLENNPENDALEILSELINLHIKGLLQNPDATQGKKKKPKYKPRQKKIAACLLKLIEG